MTEATTLGRTDAEGAMAALTHPFRDGDSAEIVKEWGEAADEAFGITLEASGLYDVAIQKLDEARKIAF